MGHLTLVALSGLPGVGKSALARPVARKLSLVLFEIDRIEAPLLRHGISGDSIGWAGYEILTSLAHDNLAIGHSVLLDSVCWTRNIRLRWAELAARHHAAFRPVEVVCSDAALHQSRVESRNRSGRGISDIDWLRVEQARFDFEPWDEMRLVLDSARPLRELVRDAIAYARGK